MQHVGQFNSGRPYEGPREALRELLELAEDSAAQLDSYIDRGRVLVAVDGRTIVGHLQVVEGRRPRVSEIENMAVRPSHRGRGLGRTPVVAVIDLVRAELRTTLLVATAAAYTGNLRFYQRLGFRMAWIEHDAFTEPSGYPARIDIDGIPLRDRVWLSMPVAPRRTPVGR